MARKRKSVDKTRASRDGHEFHENWAARKALQLLWPQDDLIGIALEGLHPADQRKAASETVEIADVTLYYGKRPTFKGSDKVVIVQLKYSISDEHTLFRNSHANKTIKKFAAAYKDHKKRHGVKETNKKLEFELVTNRPIYPALENAVQRIAGGQPLTGEAKKQGDQFTKTCGFQGKELKDFAQRVSFSGLSGSLSDNKHSLSRSLADWSGGRDPMSRAYLGGMKQLLRDKAGSEGERNNIIRLVDILDQLEVNEEDLFPCPESFPEIGEVVKREQLPNAIELIEKTNEPFLIHAAGGIGKTVFLQSIAEHYTDKHEVILFDCFGGGAYRAPEDVRHLPKRACTHIVNKLAQKGLCDPLIPTHGNTEDLIKTFRSRLEQAAETLQRASSNKKLILFVDAIDNAAEYAQERNEDCFSKELLRSLEHNQSIPNVTFVLSCRTERREIAKDDLTCEEYQLDPFTIQETQSYLKKRVKKPTSTEIEVAQARSGGNPRVLKHLAEDRGLLDQSEINKTIELDDLLKARIEEALKEALGRGYKKADINSFLAGLSVLPPPVPIDEYAIGQNMDVSAIESFVADLAPLLERTKPGIWFRDEPTETLIRTMYASNEQALKKVSENLFKQQGGSVYAARALPSLLQKRGDGDKLFELAFDERFPKEITSTVGKQAIRHARLKAAISYAAHTENYNQLVCLLVELSTIEAGNQRGADYILDNPDLIIASQDGDATRRLFEIRTSWQGKRHARLAIANILSSASSEAYRHGMSANEWITHFNEQNDDYKRDRGGYERIDTAAIPLCILSQGENETAIWWMKGWKAWYAYEVCEHLFSFINQSKLLSSDPAIDVEQFLEGLTDDIGVIAGALSFHECSDNQQKVLIKKLAKACKEKISLEVGGGFHRQRDYIIQDGVLKAAAMALSLDLKPEVLSICSVLETKTPSLWSFNDHFSDQYVTPFIIHKAITSVAEGYTLSGQDILPAELAALWPTPDRTIDDDEFEKKLKQKIAEKFDKSQKEKIEEGQQRSFSHEKKRDAERFLNERFHPLAQLAKSLTQFLSSPVDKADTAFLNLVQVWSEARKKKSLYDNSEFNMFFDLLGHSLLVFSLWTRSDLSTPSITKFWEVLSEGGFIGPANLIQIISILSKQTRFHELAGEMSVKASTMIEQEDDVDTRVSLYSSLSRAILPASVDEAAEYFKAGLDQMDAIGSGDYSFTNELLLFAASLKGEELEDKDFHTLTNICELSMGEETHKFPWYAFAQGLSRVSGSRALAKLGRWDDRTKVYLENTLMPYLIALIKDKKIEPDIALPLLRLCDPSETWSYDISHLAEAINEEKHPNHEDLIKELLVQFEENNPGVPMDTETKRLHDISSKVLGDTNELTIRLLVLEGKSKKVREQRNEHMNYRGESDQKNKKRAEERDKENKKVVKKLIDETDPMDEVAISKAIDKLDEMQNIYTLEREYLEGIRAKVNYGDDRTRYIQIISKLENLFYYRKIDELKACKDEWRKSSKALDDVFNNLDNVFLQLHPDELISHDRLSTSNLKEISGLCGTPITTLVMRLIKVFAGPDVYVPASVWMSLASIICEKSDDGEGQKALVRLLNSSSAKLSQNVEDGEWKEGMYPSGDTKEIAASLVWLKLGSPLAADRWRAAHSVRRFAKLGRWDVIDLLVSKISLDNAHPFQAPELVFYQLHARLWLLIALARVVIDHPKELIKHADIFKGIALDKGFPHVLIQHFATSIIQTGINKGNLKLSAQDKKNLDAVNKSPHPHLKEKVRKFRGGALYEERPEDAPKPQSEFFLDYDFNKTDVQYLSNVFGKYGWEMNDIITKWARTLDDSVDGMYESGGRDRSFGRRYTRGITSDYHTYGQQLGWNSLFLTAGELISECPVTEDAYDDDPWPYWLSRERLTRKDGLWLSDGIDATPLDIKINLFEKGKKELVITGNKDTILSLIGISSPKIDNGLTVEGNWCSSDGIRVRVSSALVPPDQSKMLAAELSKEDPFQAWLPSYQEGEDEEEYMHSQKETFEAWLVCPSVETKIDGNDTLGARCVMERPYFTKEITKTFSLKTDDPFKKHWKNGDDALVVIAEAWGYTGEHDEGTSESGLRLKCSKDFLQNVLSQKNMDLLIFIKLERYEQGSGHRDSRYTHTTAAVTIKADLSLDFYEGYINHLHKSKF